MQDTFCIIRLCAAQDHEGEAGNPHVGQRLLEASAKTSDIGEHDIRAALDQRFGESLE